MLFWDTFTVKNSQGTIEGDFWNTFKQSQYYKKILKPKCSPDALKKILYVQWDENPDWEPKIFYQVYEKTGNYNYYLLWQDNDHITGGDVIRQLFCINLWNHYENERSFRPGFNCFNSFKTQYIIAYVLASEAQFESIVNNIFNDVERLIDNNSEPKLIRFSDEMEEAATKDDYVNSFTELLIEYSKLTKDKWFNDNELLEDIIQRIQSDDLYRSLIWDQIHNECICGDFNDLNYEGINSLCIDFDYDI